MIQCLVYHIVSIASIQCIGQCPVPSDHPLLFIHPIVSYISLMGIWDPITLDCTMPTPTQFLWVHIGWAFPRNEDWTTIPCHAFSIQTFHNPNWINSTSIMKRIPSWLLLHQLPVLLQMLPNNRIVLHTRNGILRDTTDCDNYFRTVPMISSLVTSNLKYGIYPSRNE